MGRTDLMSTAVVVAAMREASRASGNDITGRVTIDLKRFQDWIEILLASDDEEERLKVLEARMDEFERRWGLDVDQ